MGIPLLDDGGIMRRMISLGTAARVSEEAGVDAVIVSGDRDLSAAGHGQCV